MTSTSHEPPSSRKKHPVSAALHALEKNVQPLVAFWTKFNNDWSWNNAAGLAYNLILAVFPIVITLLSLLGFFLGTLDPGAYQSALDKITGSSSSLAEAKPIVAAAFQQVRKDAGLLGAIAVVLALFYGSRLFIFMEGCLDIIYHVRPRGFLAQNLLSIVMLLLFVVIFPIAVVASAAPAFVFSLLQQSSFSQLPGSNLLFGLGGILGGLIAWYMLFQVIYMVVPNQKISFRESWLGAVVAAVLLELYLALFPLVVAHFLGIFAGTLGLLILLIFFYYFAMILFLGAEVNAFVKGVREMPHDLITMVHMMTSKPPRSAEAIKEHAAAPHSSEVPEDISPKREGSRSRVEKAKSTTPSVVTTEQVQVEARPDQEEEKSSEGKV
jgi:membrane protein